MGKRAKGQHLRDKDQVVLATKMPGQGAGHLTCRRQVNEAVATVIGTALVVAGFDRRTLYTAGAAGYTDYVAALA
jgi:hypothetical protein